MVPSLYAILALTAVLSCFTTAVAYKFLAYNPILYHSHVNFMTKISEALVDAGHEVVMLVPLTAAHLGTVKSKKMRVIEVPQSEAAALFERQFYLDDDATRMMMEGAFNLKMMRMGVRQNEASVDQCNVTIHHPGLLQQLQGENFDAAFSESMDQCGIGLFNVLGIEKFAMVVSLMSSEGMYALTGAPTVPSYTPGLIAAYGDRMSFHERLKNTFMIMVAKLFVPQLIPPYERVFTTLYPAMPSFMEIYVNASLWFINSEPLLDFPKITIHKVVDIGGITASAEHQPLNETWNAILSQRPQTVLISFGTVCKAHLMPEEYKAAIREAARRLPNVTFIWKYERLQDNVGGDVDNLVIAGWVPQNDLLRDGRLSLFLTHGGAGSIFEATAAGVPLIIVPYFGDQNRNAQLPQRRGSGLIFAKESLGDADEIVNALQKVLTHSSYREAAVRTAKMLASRPFPMRETFVRHMEFLAEFGPLRNLDHYGRHLSFVQYYLIDVISFVAAVMLVILLVLLLILRCAIRRCWQHVTKPKAKED